VTSHAARRRHRARRVRRAHRRAGPEGTSPGGLPRAAARPAQSREALAAPLWPEAPTSAHREVRRSYWREQAERGPVAAR